MKTTNSYSLQWKKDEAWRAHQRRLELDPTERYRVPIYHIGLTSYLRWASASLLPNPIDDKPITWGHVDYEACLQSYGRHRTLSDVIDFLQDLLGKKFAEAYGFEAGAVDYQYLADKINDISVDLSERGRSTPRGITRAAEWLDKQIKRLENSSISSTDLGAPVVQPAATTPIRLLSLSSESIGNQLTITADTADESGTLIEDAVLVEETKHFEKAIILSPAERILGPGFTLDEADALALQVGLIDENRRYCLGPRKYGAIVGFCLALKEHHKLLGTIPELTTVIGPRYGVDIQTRKGSSTIARRYFSLTERALKTHSTTD